MQVIESFKGQVPVTKGLKWSGVNQGRMANEFINNYINKKSQTVFYFYSS